MNLLEKFNNWRGEFTWPAKNQWRQFFTIASRREKYLTALFGLIVVVGLIILGTWFYFNYTEIKPKRAGSINIGVFSSPRFLNPVLNQINDTDRDLSTVIFSGLMKYNGQGNLINDAAAKYAIGDFGKVYEITLQKDIQWQDGKPLTADDIIFTLQVIQNPDYRSPLRALWQGIEVEKIDDLSVRFRLKNAYPFLNNLTFGILPKHLWESVAPAQFALHELNLKPVGSGPYKFKKLQKDKNGAVKILEFEAFKNYFGGEPYLTDLVFKFYSSEAEVMNAYKKEEIDAFNFLSAKNLAELNKNNGNLNIYPITLPRYFAVFFNQSQNALLIDKTIRQALAYATDKKKIIAAVFGGYGQEIDSPLLPGMAGYSDKIKIYDFAPEQAKSILANTGWQDLDNDGVLEKEVLKEKVRGKAQEKETIKLEVTLTTIDWPELAQTAQILQNQWAQIGVKLNLDIKNTSKIQNEVIKPRQYQALLFGEVLGQEPDLFHFWHSSQKKESGLNIALYENPEVDKLLLEILEDLNGDSRIQKIQRAVSLITDDLPAIFLFSPDYIFVAKKEIKGIELENLDAPSSRFSQINRWYAQTHRTWK
ncbi:MAG: Uncharacterized protein LiPW39_530 [Parcubacteria group bacterium LiPW_39]|nr:MAG: Uncharacterized protein LiPW39_530 [Parcubacteria group bacterium LiPW_39]